MFRVKRSGLVPVCQLVTAVGLVVFWIGFFAFDLIPDDAPACYLVYEKAFPGPDMALAGVLAWAAVMQLRGARRAGAVGLAAGGALAFLGLLDASYNLQNGIYALSTPDLVLNASINLWATGFGVVSVVFYVRGYRRVAENRSAE